MKIGMLTTSLPHRGDPVAGSFVAEMAEALAARGHELRVVAIRRREPRGWDDPLELRGVASHALRAPGATLLYDGGAPDRLGRFGAWPRVVGVTAASAWGAARHLRGCDALVSHFLAPSAVVAGALRGGRPHLAIAHGSDAALFAKLPVGLRALALRGATRRWYVHPGLRLAVDPGDVDAIVSPMGFVPSVRAPAPRARVLRAAVVSRLVPVKDVARALRAVAYARASGAALEVDVIGDGPLRGELAALASSLGGFAVLHGALPPADRDRVLAGCHVQLHAATTLADGRGEGAPVALLEAMGAGRCVVATGSGGVGWLVGDAGEVLDERASARAIGAALHRLALDDDAREALGERAKARAERWTWGEQARRVEEALGAR
ncbi:MAG: glycosyltransferase family 4 protein [Polyangiales bacterium]